MVHRNRVPVVTALALHPNGKLVAFAGDDHVIRLCDITTGRLSRRLVGHRDWITAVTFCHDGDELISVSRDRRAVIWDVTTGRPRALLGKHERPISSIIVGMGDKVVLSGFRAPLKIFDLASGRLQSELPCPCPDTRALAFSSDASVLAAGGRNGLVRIWDRRNGDRFELTHHQKRIRAIAFDDVDHKLFTAGDDDFVAVWDLPSRKLVNQIPLESGKVLSIALMQQKRLAVSTTDNVIRIYDRDGATKLATLTGHTGSIVALASIDNKLISGSFDTTVRVWSIRERERSVADRPISTHVISNKK